MRRQSRWGPIGPANTPIEGARADASAKNDNRADHGSSVDRFFNSLLTVKLRGRTTASDKHRGRTLSPSARGANQTTHHGPLQRLLGVSNLLCLYLEHHATLPGRP